MYNSTQLRSETLARRVNRLLHRPEGLVLYLRGERPTPKQLAVREREARILVRLKEINGE